MQGVRGRGFWFIPLLVAVVAGCASSGSYIWVNDLPQQASQPAQYLIGPGDLLDIRVRNDDRVSVRARVRQDGQVTLGMIGDVEARGRTPARLAYDIAVRLRPYIKDPGVTVSVEEAQPMTVTVVGEVVRPGVFTMTSSSGVLQALANAGGFTEFADRDEVYVIRKNPAMRIRFSYDALTQNDAKATGFTLLNGDVVTVE